MPVRPAALIDATHSMPAGTPGDVLQRHRAAVRARLLRSHLLPAGPGSITWQVNREAIVVAGWGRAILLQLAHPAVAAGVHSHSAFRGSLAASLRRLRSTVGAMLAITFGDTEQVIAAAAGINAIHDRVRGHAPPPLKLRGAGALTYSAHDPELQRWVHATLLESIPLAYERLVRPLTPAERDRYCQEAAIMEPLLGMPAGWLPRSAAHRDGYLRDLLAGGSLVVTDTSRALARAVLYPPHWHLAWPAFRAMQLLTIGTLPPSLRQAYGFEWRDRDERALARWTTLLRVGRRLLPALAREWPMARRR
ncbi:MAG: oxygenase MpaB family protein [Acidobacteriota bacterium]|nr:oxygenase MpaB family protein [Acidobacteriota bacterium]